MGAETEREKSTDSPRRRPSGTETQRHMEPDMVRSIGRDETPGFEETPRARRETHPETPGRDREGQADLERQTETPRARPCPERQVRTDAGQGESGAWRAGVPL